MSQIDRDSPAPATAGPDGSVAFGVRAPSIGHQLADDSIRRQAPGLGATLAICTASQMLATSAVLGMATIAPLVSSSLGIAPQWIGYQVSLIYFAGIFASAVSGSLVKRNGAARMSQVGLACTGGGFAGLASGLLPLMVVASLLIGVGYAFNNPCSSHMLHRVTPARLRNVVFSIKQAGVPIGGMLAALIIPPLAVSTGWRSAILISAVPGLLLGAVFGLLRGWWDDDRTPGTALLGAIVRNQTIVWSHAGLGALSLLGLLYSAIQLCVSAFTVTMLVGEFNCSPVLAGALAALVQICGAVGRISWGLLADLVGAGLLVLAVIGIVMGLCCAALLVAPQLPLAVVIGVLVVFGLSGVGWNGVMLAETARLSTQAMRGAGTGTLTGDVMVFTFVGVVLGPSSFAVLYGHVGSYSGAFACFCLPAFLGAALAAWAHGHRQTS